MTRSHSGKRDPLEVPWVRRELQEALARGEKTQQQLADEYGVSQPSISNFKRRHQAVINQILEDAGNEFAGIELAKKVNRLETYQETALLALNEGDLQTTQRALRAIADELGAIPNRVTLQAEVSAKTVYEIVGVENGDLT